MEDVVKELRGRPEASKQSLFSLLAWWQWLFEMTKSWQGSAFLSETSKASQF